MTATELKKRAIALAEKTKIDSVTPEEVGQLSNDIVEYVENVEMNGGNLGIRKTYTSVSAMESDSTAPKDDKGVLLRRGMLVNIYNQEDPESADNGKVFSFQNPGWAFRGTIDAGYATRDELTELENQISINKLDSLKASYDLEQLDSTYIAEGYVLSPNSANSKPDENNSVYKYDVSSLIGKTIRIIGFFNSDIGEFGALCQASGTSSSTIDINSIVTTSGYSFLDINVEISNNYLFVSKNKDLEVLVIISYSLIKNRVDSIQEKTEILEKNIESVYKTIIDISKLTGKSYEDVLSAINDVPAKYRQSGIIVTFKLVQGSRTKNKIYQYIRPVYDEEAWTDLTLSWVNVISNDNIYEYTYSKEDIDSKVSNSSWSGKTILWLGTSIPEGKDTALGSEGTGKSYPQIVGELLGATIINNALGSSMTRRSTRTGDYVNCNQDNLLRSLSHTIEEKQYIYENWETIKTNLKNVTKETLSESDLETMLSASFENRLLPYLNGTKPMPDLFVFDHGHNDVKSYYSTSEGNVDTSFEPTTDNVPSIFADDTNMTSNGNKGLIKYFGSLNNIKSSDLQAFISSVNRNSFIGAINFLVTLILTYNPKAKIVFITDYQNLDIYKNAVDAQIKLANSWLFPLCEVYKYLGYSQHIIPGTKNYWSESGTSTDGYTGYDLNALRIRAKDGVHPHTGGEYSLNEYAKIIANFIKFVE